MENPNTKILKGAIQSLVMQSKTLNHLLNQKEMIEKMDIAKSSNGFLESDLTALLDSINNQIEKYRRGCEALENIIRWDGKQDDLREAWIRYANLSGRNPDEDIFWQPIVKAFCVDEFKLGSTVYIAIACLNTYSDQLEKKS